MDFLNSNRRADRPLTILVVGAAGQTAREVVFSLMHLDPSVQIRAGVRDLVKGETLFGQRLSVETIYLDTAEDEAVEAAMQGVDRVVLISPISQATPQNNARVVQAAERSGVGFVVFLSGLSGTRQDAFKILGQYAQAQEAPLLHSKLPFTILQPCMFLQNLLTIYSSELAEQQTWTCPIAGEQAIAYIDVRDVSACIAKVALEPDIYIGQTLYPTAAKLVTHYELLEMLSVAIARPLTYYEISLDAFQKNLVQVGASEWESEIWTDAHRGFTFEGEPPVSVVTDVVEKVLGRKPLDPSVFIQQFARSKVFQSQNQYSKRF